MMAVLGVTTPIFILIAIGFFLVKTGLLQKTHIPGFGTFIIYLALPALIINALSKVSIQDVVQPIFMSVYALAGLSSLGLGFIVYRIILKKSFSISALNSLGGAMPNSAFIGYPLLLQLFPNPPTVAFTMALMVENIIVLPFALLLLEAGHSQGKGNTLVTVLVQILKRLATNPMIISIFIGTLISLMQIQIPSVLNKSISLLAQAAAPVALVFIGATLASNTWHGKLNDTLVVATFKLLIHPALALLFITLLPPMGADLTTAVIVITAAPMVSVFPVIGAKYGHGVQAASTMLITTLLAFFTITFILWLYQ